MTETQPQTRIPTGDQTPATARYGSVPVVDISADPPPSGAPVLRRMELAGRHGPAFVQRLHGRDTLFVSGLGLATELADEERFAKSVTAGLENVREFTADGLFTAYNHEPNWARAHDILMPAFALGSMRVYHPAMLRVARRLFDSWDRSAAASAPVDVAGDMTRATLDTIGLAGFGYDFGSFGRAEPHPFVSSLVRCLDWAMTELSRAPGDDRAERDAAFRADADYLASVVDEVIAARTARAGSAGDDEDGAQDEDLLGLMLGARHPVDGTALAPENIRHQVITFLIAGHETTSGTLAFALYYLAKHPAVLRAAQREVDELWGDEPDPEPSFEDIGRLRYVRQVLNEALRLWPTAPGFGRVARGDTVLGGGLLPMPAGREAVVLTPMLHRDPVWGDNPELFDPARFSPEAEAARPPHAFKPFGTGERACIGRQFALHEATMILGMLLHRYRLLDHADYRLRIKQTLTLKPEGFTLALARRTPADRAANSASLLDGGAQGPDGRTQGPREGEARAGLPERVRQGTGLLLLHGSNYGTCRDFAAQLAEEAADLGCETAVAALDDRTAALPTDRTVVITAASYNGRPTDDAAAFVRWLENAKPGAAEGVSYAVLGVGDRNWAATYQRVPTLIDERLAALGARRVVERAAADASGDLAGAVEAFTGALRTALLERHGDPESAAGAHSGTAAAAGAGGAHAEQGGAYAYAVTEVTGGPLDPLAARHGMVPMTVTDARDLTRAGYPRVKRLVRLALPEGTSYCTGYRTGDHLSVLPANEPGLVERAAAVLHADPGTVLSITPNRTRDGDRARRAGAPFDRPLTVRELLTHHVELQDRPTATQLATLAELNPCPPERAALRALADDSEARAADQRTLLDLIADHPALREGLTWPAVLGLLPPVRPRHYSISSSPGADPRHADLMVSLLHAPARSGRGDFRGTGSGYLNSVRPGETVLARVQPCREAFRVPHAADTPVIMVAAGTGLAPFRGAIADRGALLAGGTPLAPALCYFGCDAPYDDYLHAEELHAAERAGAVAMRPTFSEAPVEGRRFVQDRIAAEADEVWGLLEAGAKVYVCGDGSRMAPGVRDAFLGVYRRHTPGSDAAAAGEWLRELCDEGRYVEDVYTG